MIYLKNYILIFFLVTFVSPSYNNHYQNTITNYESIIHHINYKYQNKYGVKFIRFDKLPINYNQNNFLDAIHLNEIGSKKFSVILAKSLNESVFEEKLY